jgi:hypothetical protein
MKQEKKESILEVLNRFLIIFGIGFFVGSNVHSQDLHTPTHIVVSDNPKIFVPEPKFNFGVVDEGPDLVHSFKIYNKGKTVLRIIGKTTDAVPILIPKTKNNSEILPGRYLFLKTVYHTKGRPGHATKIIMLSTNDPNNPEVKLQLDMTVMREVDVQPSVLYLYGIPYKKLSISSIKVLGKPGVPLKVISAESTKNVIRVTNI